MNASPDIASLQNIQDRPHAVVIGSGFGGLAAAIRLGARGYRVSVLERLSQPGGRARVFSQDGFTFDAGPTIITAPFLLDELWQLAGARLADDVDLRPVTPFYRIAFHDGSTFDCTGDAAQMHAQILEKFPADIHGYEKFVALSEAIYKIGFEQLGHKPFGSLVDMLRILPDLVKLSGYRSVSGLVNSYIKNPNLRIALSFHPLLVGGNPLRTSAIYCLILHLERKFGVHFPKGGTGALVEAMVGLIARQSGNLRCNATVDRIIVQGRTATGVRLESGLEIKADIIVSNADAGWTYQHLLRGKKKSRWTDRRIARAHYSMGLLVWYFGTNRQWPAVPHHTILLGPRHDELLRDMFERKILADDFSLYLHRPTATDPSLAPAGGDAFYVLSPVPNLQGEIDWQSQAEPYRQAIEAHLNKTCLPGLTGSIVSSKLITPVDFKHDFLSLHGAGFGMEPRLMQSAWFRPHNKSEEVDNLFLVGAGTHPGAGVPGVLSSARVLDEVVPHGNVFR
ncbi:MAG: phytoene dehydrogenase [Rhodospirillales bacterium 20-60-12]|nr:MAG: phytoene dehydrogenase [Rhodospirillales bacterium 20-60-12]HQT66894.1 phytoene desaturase [Acetobacteraceae bacterium]